MKYALLIQGIEEIKERILLDKEILNKLDPQKKLIFKKSAHKSLTIEIYTFWENFCKSLAYQCYNDYKGVLLDKRFLVNFFQFVQEKSYTRQLFLKGIDDNKIDITKDNLCHTNNMNFKELKALFKRIMLEVEEFEKHINGFSGIEQIKNKLQSSQVIPAFDEANPNYSLMGYFEAYLNLIVTNRNIVAHEYQINEIYSLEQLELLVEFIELATGVVFEFCVSQIIKKSELKKINSYKRFYPLKVIKSNAGGSNAIIGIGNVSNLSINREEELFYFDREMKIYRIAKIVKICENRTECNQILPLHQYSLEIQTAATINSRNPNFKIGKLYKNNIEYKYPIVV